MASVAKRTWTHNGEQRTKWVVRYTDMGGKRRLKTFETKKDADRYRTKVETEMEKGIHTADSASVTVAEAARLWLESCELRARSGDQMGRLTVVQYRRTTINHVLPFLGNIKLSRLTAPMIKEWVNDLLSDPEAPRGQRTVQLAVAVLRMLIGDVQERGLIAHNIVREAPPRIPMKKKTRVAIPTKDEVRMILGRSSGRIRPIVHTAIFTGMRAGEIRGLTWDRVDFRSEVIEVRQAADFWGNLKSPKSFAGIRDIPMAPNLSQLLREWRLASPNTAGGLVFPTQTGKVMWHASMHHDFWRPFMKSIGLSKPDGTPKYHFHALRHVAASLLIEQGLQPKRIQQIMGHASITMTFDVYGHLFNDGGDGHAAVAAIGRDLLG